MDPYNSADGSSYANSSIVQIPHYSVKVNPHLKTRVVQTQVIYTLHPQQKTNTIIFDTIKLNIKTIKFGQHQCKFTTGENTSVGSPLKVELPQQLEPGTTYTNLLILSQAKEPPSLTWGDYVYTQNQPIYCRSLFPCHDTPSSKSTFQIEIILDEEDKNLNVFASGIRESKGVNKFKMDLPIPTYLFAFLIGNFEHRMLSDRLGVVAEPQVLENVCQEVEDSEKFLATLEKILFQYKFGQYNLCILPKSFPYGGMQNPIYTFLSPSVVTGDKTGLSVVIHEMAHSWTGNLVSCKNWENFWMNQGFTVFVESKAIKQLYGEQLYQLFCLIGQDNLLKTIDNFGKDHPFTQLHPTLNHCNPDDAFSTVPYFKGMIFLTYQQSLIGEEHFLIILRTFLEKFSKKSVDYEDWKLHLQTYVKENKIELKEEIDWDLWVHKPGYPPRLDLFKSAHLQNIKSIVSNHKVNQNGLFQIIEQIMYDFSPLNIQRLQLLLGEIQKQGLKLQQVKRIDEKFKLSEYLLNYELMSEWFKICLKAGYTESLDRLDSKVLKRIGRMKFIRPLYRYLRDMDKELAVKYFQQNKHNYSIIANELIKKDLGITE